MEYTPYQWGRWRTRAQRMKGPHTGQRGAPQPGSRGILGDAGNRAGNGCQTCVLDHLQLGSLNGELLAGDAAKGVQESSLVCARGLLGTLDLGSHEFRLDGVRDLQTTRGRISRVIRGLHFATTFRGALNFGREE